MKRSCHYLAVLLCLAGFQFARAQSSLDVAIGFGAAQAKASGNGIEGDPNSTNFFSACAPGSSATCAASKSLSGFMMGFQGNIMLSKYLGVGGGVSFQPTRQDYAVYPQSVLDLGGGNLQSRMTFYDFNGVVQPIKNKRIALQVAGGIGGANLRFYVSGSSSSSLIGTQNFSQYYGSSNHFQVHTGVGAQIFVTKNIFIRPQFDIHYVPNLTQFGSNVVPQESVWVGYRWGSE